MVSRRTVTTLSRLHRWLYRRTQGRIGGRIGAMELVLLTTTGRSSGLPRTTPLTALPYGDGVVLIASDGGSRRNPQWYQNLQATPEVTVQRGSRHLRLRARDATAAERAALWPQAVRLYPGYARYQARTARTIPVVICEPSD